MDDQFFRDVFRALRNEVTTRRANAKLDGKFDDADKWSAVDGLFSQAEKRMRS